MAFTRRNKGAPYDIVYNRAWNAAVVGDLPAGSPAAHGDVCLVAADGLWRMFMDDGTWQTFTAAIAAGGTITLGAPLVFAAKPVSFSGQFRSYGWRSAGPQSIPNITTTNLLYTDNLYDTGGVHSTSVNTSRFTVPVGGAGVWLFTANVILSTASACRFLIRCHKNGSGSGLVASDVPYAASVGNISNQLTVIDVAADGDYYEFDVYQDTGGAVNAGWGLGGGFGIAIKLF